METRKVNLFVFDTKENFEKSKPYLGIDNFKSVTCVENVEQFETTLATLKSDDLIFLVVHVFYTEAIDGVRRFAASNLRSKYKALGDYYISEGDEVQIAKEIFTRKLPEGEILKYHEVQSNLDRDRFKAITKRDLIAPAGANGRKFEQIDYAVITALYNDEFEEIEKLFDFPQDEQIVTQRKVFKVGYTRDAARKKIVAAVPSATGMVDSAVIATLMAEYFSPKYLLMSGVCGGSEDYNFGDIILAKQLFTYQKGKISDVRDPRKGYDKIELFDRDQNPISYDQLFDAVGNQVKISVEKFEMEHDTIIPLDPVVEDLINPKIRGIMVKINEAIKQTSFLKKQHEVSAYVAPIACSTMVINKAGYFEDTIRTVNRKTAAVEMESYGVARACQFANGGAPYP